MIASTTVPTTAAATDTAALGAGRSAPPAGGDAFGQALAGALGDREAQGQQTAVDQAAAGPAGPVASAPADAAQAAGQAQPASLIAALLGRVGLRHAPTTAETAPDAAAEPATEEALATGALATGATATPRRARSTIEDVTAPSPAGGPTAAALTVPPAAVSLGADLQGVVLPSPQAVASTVPPPRPAADDGASAILGAAGTTGAAARAATPAAGPRPGSASTSATPGPMAPSVTTSAVSTSAVTTADGTAPAAGGPAGIPTPASGTTAPPGGAAPAVRRASASAAPMASASPDLTAASAFAQVAVRAPAVAGPAVAAEAEPASSSSSPAPAGQVVAASGPAAPQPTAPGAAAAAPAPATAPTLTEQLAPPIVALRGGPEGEHVVVVRVAPEHLGPVTVHATLSHGDLDVQLFAPTADARDALRSMLTDLRRDLGSGAGGAATTLSLGSGDAPQTGGRDTASAWTGDPSGREQGTSPGWSPRIASAAAPDGTRLPARTLVPGSALLDVLA